MQPQVFVKKICMTELSVSLSAFPYQHFFELQKNAKLTAAFVYMLSGSAELQSSNLCIHCGEGDLIYIPENVSYTLRWTTDEQIRYYTVSAVARDYNTAMMHRKFELQKVNALSSPETKAIFDDIYGKMSENDEIKRIEAVGVYYSFYARALQYLKADVSAPLHPALANAMRIIEENYAQEISVENIAKACYISESRLYGLFHSQLHTSPVSYRNRRRIQKAAELLQTDMPVEEISEKTGFQSVPYFYAAFKKITGITPNKYRNILKGKE